MYADHIRVVAEWDWRDRHIPGYPDARVRAISDGEPRTRRQNTVLKEVIRVTQESASTAHSSICSDGSRCGVLDSLVADLSAGLKFSRFLKER